MPMPAFEEIRRAQHDDDDDRDDQEDYFESVWEHATTFPTVVTIMGKPWTLDSTGGLPPWATSAAEALTDGHPTTTASARVTSAPPSLSSSAIGMSRSTTVNVATEVSGPGALAGSSATHAAPPSSTAPGNVAATASSAATKDQDDSGGGSPPLGLILAGVIIPVLVISLLAFTAFIVMRRRRQRRDAMASTEEMKHHLHDDYPEPPVVIVQAPPPPPIIREPSPHHTPSPPPRVVTPVPPAPPPVIVSAMNPANNASYFTGIDTSEALSIRTNSVRSSGPPQQRPAGFMLDGEFHEEPPPPYRPRSVPPISRDSSMRTTAANYRSAADCASLQLAHHGDLSPRHVNNPFADPSDDGVSIMSGGPPMNPFARDEDDDDRLSVVSDLSYQREPATVHQGV
ncbi:hypothetical protein SLS58_000990 [Diplodia intermedia]|uniref:Transmembrane protein n=1 Tax=Diplodia intermedia TaxID=856260 RepID=A0ABR3U3I5_9PEZI